MMWLLMWMACGHVDETHAPAERDLSERVAYVPVVASEEVPITTLPAEVVPTPGGRHDLGPGVSGRLLRWHVAEGDVVEAGQALAELHSTELAGLGASKSAAGARLAAAREALRLAEAGAARGVRSAVDVQQARAELAAARSAYGTARQQLDALDTTTREGDVWVWRAPSAGVVDDVRCGLGQIDAGRTCLGLVVSDGVVLEVRVPERHLEALEGPIRADFASADGRTWGFAELGRAPAVDPHTRTRTFRFGLDGGELPPLQGMSGRARLSVLGARDLHRVSDEAVTWVEGVPTVFVRRGEGYEADPRDVEVLGRADDMVVVRGLVDDEQVAVRGVFLLKSLAALEEGA